MSISKKKNKEFNSNKKNKNKSNKTLFVGQLFGYLTEQEEKIRSNPKKQFFFFVLGFLFFYLLLTGIIGLVPEEFFKSITGQIVVSTLKITGFNSNEIGLINCVETNWLGFETQSNCYSFIVNDKKIIISWLCTGILEIIILASAILASFGVEWKKKLQGVLIAIIAGIVFNLLRLYITIMIIITSDIKTIELAHDALFRIILFLYIFVVYVAWFYWATIRKK